MRFFVSQVLIIFAPIWGVTVPLVGALMSRRTTAAYRAVLRDIKTWVPGFRPGFFTCDFEGALRRMFVEVWGAIFWGCVFHFQSAVRKKCMELGCGHDLSLAIIDFTRELAFSSTEAEFEIRLSNFLLALGQDAAIGEPEAVACVGVAFWTGSRLAAVFPTRAAALTRFAGYFRRCWVEGQVSLPAGWAMYARAKQASLAESTNAIAESSNREAKREAPNTGIRGWGLWFCRWMSERAQKAAQRGGGQEQMPRSQRSETRPPLSQSVWVASEVTSSAPFPSWLRKEKRVDALKVAGMCVTELGAMWDVWVQENTGGKGAPLRHRRSLVGPCGILRYVTDKDRANAVPEQVSEWAASAGWCLVLARCAVSCVVDAAAAAVGADPRATKESVFRWLGASVTRWCLLFSGDVPARRRKAGWYLELACIYLALPRAWSLLSDTDAGLAPVVMATAAVLSADIVVLGRQTSKHGRLHAFWGGAPPRSPAAAYARVSPSPSACRRVVLIELQHGAMWSGYQVPPSTITATATATVASASTSTPSTFATAIPTVSAIVTSIPTAGPAASSAPAVLPAMRARKPGKLAAVRRSIARNSKARATHKFDPSEEARKPQWATSDLQSPTSNRRPPTSNLRPPSNAVALTPTATPTLIPKSASTSTSPGTSTPELPTPEVLPPTNDKRQATSDNRPPTLTSTSTPQKPRTRASEPGKSPHVGVRGTSRKSKSTAKRRFDPSEEAEKPQWSKKRWSGAGGRLHLS